MLVKRALTDRLQATGSAPYLNLIRVDEPEPGTLRMHQASEVVEHDESVRKAA
jgi:hypothetical protein